MTPALRALKSSLVILTLVLLGSVAHAQKQKMAVLGLEAVVGENGKIEPEDTKFAKELTKALKSRAELSATYTPLKEHRELVDEKLMNNCNAETAACMAPIGESMKADVILFGNVKNTKKGWLVNLRLVSVAKKTFISSDTNVSIGRDETTGAALGAWVRERMRKLTGETAEGVLVIKVEGNVDGRVLVNDTPKETLKNGEAKLSLPEGVRHKITVEVDGYDLWVQDGVTVSADKPTPLAPDLSKKKPLDTTITDPNKGGGGTTTTTTGGGEIISRTGTEGTGRKSKTGFKVAAAVGIGGAAITGTLWAVSYFAGPVADYRNHDIPTGGTFNTTEIAAPVGGMCPAGKICKVGYDKCGGTFSDGPTQSKFDSACSRMKLVNYGLIPATAVLGLVGVGALVYVMVTSDDDTTERAVGRQKKRKNLMVTPVITPDGSGATLRFDW